MESSIGGCNFIEVATLLQYRATRSASILALYLVIYWNLENI